MPITSSAKKALRQNRVRRVKNVSQKKALKELLKSFEKSPSVELLSRVYQALDKAARQNLIKKNTASRKKARLTRLLKVK